LQHLKWVDYTFGNRLKAKLNLFPKKAG